MDLISIIVPVFNIASYLPRCLDSLCTQTHRNLEIITVNDGSNDDSGAVLVEYAAKDSRIRVIHKANGGVTSARNAGIESAQGAFIGFCDGDDVVEANMYEHLLANLKKYNVDISHCGMSIDGLDGQQRFFYNTGDLYVHSHEESLKELLSAQRIEPSCCNKLYKRELFDSLQFDTTITINEDLLMNAMLFQRANKSVYEDVCLYHYIRREGSASKSSLNDKIVFHPVIVREKIMDLFNNESTGIQSIACKNYLHANISTYSLLLKHEAGNYKSYRAQYRRNLIEKKLELHLLPCSSRMHAYLIIYAPFLCKAVHALYYRLFNKKAYG